LCSHSQMWNIQPPNRDGAKAISGSVFIVGERDPPRKADMPRGSRAADTQTRLRRDSAGTRIVRRADPPRLPLPRSASSA
jgi:hypothetical protein